MHKNALWGMVAILLITNVLTFSLWKSSQPVEDIQQVDTGNETKVIAKIGDKEITSSMLLTRLESLYGKETLTDMINNEVVWQLAEAENIEISEQEIDREMMMLQTSFHESMTNMAIENKEKWRAEIKYLTLLEELLTKDIVISEQDIKTYYEENKNLYEIPTMYHISQIILPSEAEALDAIDELNGGSSFSSLAMERSIDTFSASEGGSLGFLPINDQSPPLHYLNEVVNLKPGEWTKPIDTEEGVAILYLEEILEGKKFSYKDVRNQIRRQLAMQETDGTYSAKPFWSEVGVNLMYSEG